MEFKVGDRLLVEYYKGFKNKKAFITTVIEITKTGNYRLSNKRILCKDGVNLWRFGVVDVRKISQEEKNQIVAEWKLKRERNRSIEGITGFKEWEKISTDDIDKILGILGKHKEIIN